MKKTTTKIILMFAVITLLAITTTSCIMGFQSAQIKIKFTYPAVFLSPPPSGFSTDIEYTFTDDDDRFTMKEVKFKVSGSESETSKTATGTVTWFGYNQEIKDAKFKSKLTTSTTSNGTTTSRSNTGKVTLKKDIKAGLTVNEIDLNKDLKSR